MFTQNNIPSYMVCGKSSQSPLNFFCGPTGGLEEPEFSILSYINIIYYSGNFLEAIYCILVEKDGFCEEGADCYYPDINSPELAEHFKGVRFEIGGLSCSDYQLEVSELICFNYFKKACEHFLELHPEQIYRDYLNNILDNWKPLNNIEG